MTATSESFEHSRYAELEAEEVEMEGRQRSRIFRRTREHRSDAATESTTRRVRSLSIALERTAEKRILLEGVPGAGKSIALRHVASRMAGRVSQGRRYAANETVLPLYVNLKNFRPSSRPVTADAVKSFVIKELNPHGSGEVDRFLDSEFQRGIDDGSWLFLFDSFDEIPDILSSTDADEVVEEYATAITTFLGPLNHCRGVLASREYRGPGRIGWPRFKIVDLSDERQRDLIEKWNLAPDLQATLFVGLENADAEMRKLAQTPLALSLLCSYERSAGRFPSGSYVLFSEHVQNCLDSNRKKISEKFAVSIEDVRRAAEGISYLMASVPGLGLQVYRDDLKPMLQQLRPDLSLSQLDGAIDSLVYCKLARPVAGESGLTQFTFFHRRIQEYFATCVVLQEPDRVTPEDLVTDHNWREAAVTLLQSHSEELSQPILRASEELLIEGFTRVKSVSEFAWPKGALHVLGILSSGLAEADNAVRPTTREHITDFLRLAWTRGRRHDRYWTLEVMNLAARQERLTLLREGFKSGSSLIRGECYRQAGLVKDLPDDVILHLKKGLVTLWAEGKLDIRASAIRAQVRRLQTSRKLLNALTTVSFLPVIDMILSVVCAILVVDLPSQVRIGDTPRLAVLGVVAYSYVLLTRISLEMLVMSRHITWASQPRAMLRKFLIIAHVARLNRGPGVGQALGGIGMLLRFLLVAFMLVLLLTRVTNLPYTLLGTALVLLSGLLYPSIIHYLITDKWSMLVLWPLRYLAELLAWIARRVVIGLRKGRKVILIAFGMSAIVFFVWLIIASIIASLGSANETNTTHARRQPASTNVPTTVAPAASAEQATASATAGHPSGNIGNNSSNAFLDFLIGLSIFVGSGALVLMLGYAVHISWVKAKKHFSLNPIDQVISKADRQRARDVVERAGAEPLKIGDVIAVLNGCDNDRVFWEYLTQLRRTGSFRSSPRAVKMLSDLSATVELSRGQVLRVAPGSGADFKDWVAHSSISKFIIRTLSDGSLDEISRLVMESNRLAMK